MSDDEATVPGEIGGGEYRKFVYGRITPVKTIKNSLRALARDQMMLRTAHAFIGIASEVPEVMDVLNGWLIGDAQLNTVDQQELRLELSDVLYYTTAGCRLLKVDMPSMKKRVHLDGSAARNVMALSYQACRLLNFVKKVYGGRPITDEIVGEMQQQLALFTYTLWGVIEALTGEKVHVIAALNKAKLEARSAAEKQEYNENA